VRSRRRIIVIAAALACAAGTLPATQASAATTHTAITVDAASSGYGRPFNRVADDHDNQVDTYHDPTSLYGYEDFAMALVTPTNPPNYAATMSIGSVSGDLSPGTYTFKAEDFSPTRDQISFDINATELGGNGWWCDSGESGGTVVIAQATHDASGNLTSLALHYSIDCNFNGPNTKPHAVGEVRWQSNIALTALTAPTAVDFHRIQAGVTSAARLATVSNVGTTAVTLGTSTLSGADPSNFTLGTGCNGKTLQPGASCDIAITAAPPGPEEVTATWSISDGTAQGKRVGLLSAAGMYAPTDVTAVGDQGRITLDFQAQDYAAESNAPYDPVEFFTLLRGTSPDNLTVISTNASELYQDLTTTPGVVYYYQFRMVAQSGQYVTSTLSNGAVSWALGGAGRYSWVLPYRLLDTRSGRGAPKHTVGPGQTITVKVTGQGGIPATGVSAVAFNLTAVHGTANTYLTAYPAGEARPVVSALNVGAGQVRANLVTVPIGAGGAVSIYNRAGTVDILADLAGYYTSADSPTPRLGDDGTPGQFHPFVPTRIIDTRTSPLGALPGHYILDQAVDIPGTGSRARAIVLNVTVVAPAAAGFVTASEDPANVPTTSTVNFAAHQTTANLAIVPLTYCTITPTCSQYYEFAIYNGSPGAVHLAVDAVGYYDDNWLPGGLRFHAIDPLRIADTRTGLGWPSQLGPNGVASVAVPSNVSDPLTAAVALNVTAVGPTTPTYLTVWPGGTNRPLASNLNVLAGQALANSVVTGVGAGNVFDVYNSAGNTQFVADLVGTFEAWPTAPTVAGQLGARVVGPLTPSAVPGVSSRAPI
jgi:hypothetical protein